MQKISKIPVFGEKSDDVKTLQKALNATGLVAHLEVDGDFGPLTRASVSRFQYIKGLPGSGIIGPQTIEFLGIAVNQEKDQKTKAPWFWKLKSYEGKGETDKAFVKEMSFFWKFVGLPGFKTIIGNSFAWCGLFVAVGLVATNVDWQKNGAGAKNWDKFGQAIEWQKNGFPQGAIIRINHKANCGSGSGNHVTLSNGDCSANDLKKENATFSGFGGNQGNKAKVSTYPVKNICAVRWPLKSESGEAIPLPGPVLESKNCSNGKTDKKESTR